MTTHDNLQLMQTLDDSWNNQDWDTFSKRHAENTVVYWPGKPEPTRGVHDHKAENIAFFQTFPDNHIYNRPYKVLIGQGDWTCSIARFTGTMKGPMTGPDGKQYRRRTSRLKLTSVPLPIGRMVKLWKRTSSMT